MSGDPDVAVVGSGIAALTTSALAALQGARVVVCEQGDTVGGYLHAFRRGDYVFDPAVHVLGDPPLFDGVLALLGVEDRVQSIPLDRFYRVQVEDVVMDAPADLEAFVEAMVAHFPHEAENIRAFMRLCRTVHVEAHDLPPRIGLKALDAVAARLPTLFRYRKARLGEVMDDHFADPRLKAAIAGGWIYLGVPPSETSFQTFAQLLCANLEGVCTYRGGASTLIDALVHAIEMRGGRVLVEHDVTRILVEDGRAIGIELADGTIVRSKVVVSGADPFQTYDRLVGAAHMPESFMRRIHKMRPGGSAFLLFAATTTDLSVYDPPAQIFSYSHLDYDEVMRRTLLGEVTARSITAGSAIDPTLAPPGEHVVVASALAPYETPRPWPELKDRCQERMIAAVEETMPGFAEGLTFAESGTPLTLEAYSRNAKGAIHSFEQTPDQIETRRPAQLTPIKGLFLSSQWTSTGGSSLRSFVAGIAAAKLALAELGHPDELPDFRSVPNLLVA